mmetsp:Transcript_37074/g.81024  ORF Transcript_37074/g.81024 Transcript_37074/m.81024 type:complete len:229 (-) Transcript_37074:692-1378(-)
MIASLASSGLSHWSAWRVAISHIPEAKIHLRVSLPLHRQIHGAAHINSDLIDLIELTVPKATKHIILARPAGFNGCSADNMGQSSLILRHRQRSSPTRSKPLQDHADVAALRRPQPQVAVHFGEHSPQLLCLKLLILIDIVRHEQPGRCVLHDLGLDQSCLRCLEIKPITAVNGNNRSSGSGSDQLTHLPVCAVSSVALVFLRRSLETGWLTISRCRNKHFIVQTLTY